MGRALEKISLESNKVNKSRDGLTIICTHANNLRNRFINLIVRHTLREYLGLTEKVSKRILHHVV